MKSRHYATIALILLLSSSSVGHAAAIADFVSEEATGIAATIWEATKRGAGGFWTASASLFAKPDPFEYLPGIAEPGPAFHGDDGGGGYRFSRDRYARRSVQPSPLPLRTTASACPK